MNGGGGMGMGGGYMQAAGLVGMLGTDIWGMTQGSDLYGSKPRVAPWHKLKLDEEQKKSILGNISNFDDIAKLGELYKDYITSQTESLLPGYGETLAEGQKSALNLLEKGNELLGGELPQDVKDQIQRSSAYTAFSGGYAGSGMAHALTARDLGLTSLDLMRQGASMIGQGGNSAQQWAGLAKGDIMAPSNYMVTPQQTAEFDMQNQILRQNYLQNLFNVRAAPDPSTVGMYGTLSSRFGSLAGMSGGNGMDSGSSMGGMDMSSIMSLLKQYQGGGGVSADYGGI